MIFYVNIIFFKYIHAFTIWLQIDKSYHMFGLRHVTFTEYL